MESRFGSTLCRVLAVGFAALFAAAAHGQARTFSFAYDQPTTTAYGIAGNIFDAKLKELSKGTMSINQFPGGQLGQEPQLLQKLRSGDIDFVITSTANLIVWDNRCVQHRATAYDPAKEGRVIRRCTVIGDVPV